MRPFPTQVSLLLLGALLPLPRVAGQTVEGRVLDPDAVPISEASVAFRLESRELVARVASDDTGFFRFRSIEPGEYFVVVERLGYQTTTTPISLREGDSISVELRMAVEAIPLEPIVVTASPRPRWEYTEPPALWEFWERRDYMQRLGIGDFFTYQDLKPLQGSPVALAIIQLNPYLSARQNDERPNAFHLQGRLDCPPMIFLDGHVLPPYTNAFRPEEEKHIAVGNGAGRYGLTRDTAAPSPLIDNYISLSEIGAIEVYRGASDIPGEFRHPGSNCGVVAVWSRRGTVR